MSENPLQLICKTFEQISQSVQAQLTQFIGSSHKSSTTKNVNPHSSFSLSSSPSGSTTLPNRVTDNGVNQPINLQIKASAGPVTKEDLGTATWTFLHTLGAQYPDKPTRQQKKDVKELMAILSRMYPCKECADHFKEVLRTNPVRADSQADFSQWLCRVHNVVNRSLNKPSFPCERIDARWGKLDCEQRTCDLQGSTTLFGIGKP